MVKKRKKVIEDHWDDCGEDMSSLGPDIDDDPAAYNVVNAIDVLFQDSQMASEHLHALDELNVVPNIQFIKYTKMF